MNIYEKVLNIQMELKVCKNNFNDFGNYKYRSCEDILEALKPLLKKYKLFLKLDDEIEEFESRHYVKARAEIKDIEKPNDFICGIAYAREPEEKKKYDSSQLTGSASSYARKYALAGLFLIDDNKDADYLNKDKDFTEKDELEEKRKKKIKYIEKFFEKYGVEIQVLKEILEPLNKSSLKNCTCEELDKVYKLLEAMYLK